MGGAHAGFPLRMRDMVAAARSTVYWLHCSTFLVMPTKKDPFTVIAKRKLASVGKVLFDSDTHEILGRTGIEWGKKKIMTLATKLMW